MVRLYIIRHADPDYETNAETGGTITEHGREEAKALASYLEKHDISHAYSSPLGRALDTAKLGLPPQFLEKNDIQIEPWARELSTWRCRRGNSSKKKPPAVWDSPSPMIREQLKDTIAGTSKECVGWTHVCKDHQPHQPKYQEFCKAADEFLYKNHGIKREGQSYVLTKLEHRHDRVAIFMHHGSGVTWLSHLLGIPLPIAHGAFWMAPSSVTVILFDENLGPLQPQEQNGGSHIIAAPRALCVGGTEHLAVAGLETQNSKFEEWKRPSGIKANFW